MVNRRKFNQWFLVLVAFVVLVLGYIYFSVTPRNAASLKALNSHSESAQEPVAAETNIAADTDKVDLVKITDEELVAIIDELAPHQYHADPFIEARTVHGLYSLCNNELSYVNMVNQKLVANNQTQVANDLFKYCADAKLRYPILLNDNDVYNTIEEIPTNTELGKLLKQDYNEYDPMNAQLYLHKESERLRAVLNAENSVLMTESTLAVFISLHIQNGEILPFSQWLDSQDADYNNMVYRFAMSKMACRYQPSEVCSSVGLVSLMFCYEDHDLCGLDFDTIYSMSVMPGMQQDVELLISHLDQIALSN